MEEKYFTGQLILFPEPPGFSGIFDTSNIVQHQAKKDPHYEGGISLSSNGRGKWKCSVVGLLERDSICHLGLVGEQFAYQTTIYLICTTICTIMFRSGQLQVSNLLWHYHWVVRKH